MENWDLSDPMDKRQGELPTGLRTPPLRVPATTWERIIQIVA